MSVVFLFQGSVALLYGGATHLKKPTVSFLELTAPQGPKHFCMPSVLPPGAKLKGREGSKLELYATLGFIGLGLVSGTVIWRLNKYHRRSMFNKRLKTLELRDASSQI